VEYPSYFQKNDGALQSYCENHDDITTFISFCKAADQKAVKTRILRNTNKEHSSLDSGAPATEVGGFLRWRVKTRSSMRDNGLAVVIQGGKTSSVTKYYGNAI
jgi:hypothetical protein